MAVTFLAHCRCRVNLNLLRGQICIHRHRCKTGKVRHSINANTRNFPASLTKVMTLYLLFEAIDRKKLTFDSQLKVSRRAALQPASKLGLKPGQTIKVRDAAAALIVRSANDVATVVAEALSGSERKFALRMTQKARQIGMSRTTFRNASGLPHRGQMSTATDMAVLTREMITSFPQHYHMFSKTSLLIGGAATAVTISCYRLIPEQRVLKRVISGPLVTTSSPQRGKTVTDSLGSCLGATHQVLETDTCRAYLTKFIHKSVRYPRHRLSKPRIGGCPPEKI